MRAQVCLAVWERRVMPVETEFEGWNLFKREIVRQIVDGINFMKCLSALL